MHLANQNQFAFGNNWAFLDMQNLYKGVQERGWKIQWEEFRKYLSFRYMRNFLQSNFHPRA